MNGGVRMRNGLLLLAAAALVAGCGGGVPGFLGREGNAADTYNPRGEPAPEAALVPFRTAVAERGLYGVIVRVTGEAPGWNYWGAQLRPVGKGTPEAGVLAFDFVAYPPPEPATMQGAPQTRILTAAVFIPNVTARKVKSVRLTGAGSAQTLAMPTIPAPELAPAPAL